MSSPPACGRQAKAGIHRQVTVYPLDTIRYRCYCLGISAPSNPARDSMGSYVLRHMSTIAFIDGENFRFKCRSILTAAGISVINWDAFDIPGLITTLTTPLSCTEHRFYAAKIETNPTTIEKSRALQEQQRRLKFRLEKNGCLFVTAGRVRAREGKDADGNPAIIFKEKGVDVRIAVDMVAFAADNKLDEAILLSSDSDLQPAIGELTRRGKRVVYVGFEGNLNKGMTFTSSRTIVISNKEVIARYNKAHPSDTQTMTK